MPKPCLPYHPEPVADCRVCWLAANDARYAKLWDLPFTGEASTAPARTARKPPPCVSLGLPTGETRPCQACGGKTQDVPLHACATYGVCTVSKVVKLEDGTPVRCCAAMCPGYAAAASAQATAGPILPPPADPETP